MYNTFGRFCDGFFSFGHYQFGGLMFIIGLLFVLVIGYFLLKKRNFNSFENNESPTDVLKKRYVNGEISKEEYLEKKDILKQKP